MNCMKIKQLGGALLVIAIFCAGAFAHSGGGQSENSGSNKGLEGTWRIEVQTYNCSTGVRGPAFNSLLTFSRGGTMSGTTANPVFRPGQRTSDYGVWNFTGQGTYTAISEAFILFSSPASFPVPPLARGVQRLTQAIHVDEDQLTSAASVQFFDESGAQTVALCADATGQRMK